MLILTKVLHYFMPSALYAYQIGYNTIKQKVTDIGIQFPVLCFQTNDYSQDKICSIRK